MAACLASELCSKKLLRGPDQFCSLSYKQTAFGSLSTSTYQIRWMEIEIMNPMTISNLITASVAFTCCMILTSSCTFGSTTMAALTPLTDRNSNTELTRLSGVKTPDPTIFIFAGFVAPTSSALPVPVSARGWRVSVCVLSGWWERITQRDDVLRKRSDIPAVSRLWVARLIHTSES